ncbi:hypothetical protein NL676_019748 [Syzygium grande]|nr:hypothetical protein NL676_019748 [Syzygium grande]
MESRNIPELRVIFGVSPVTLESSQMEQKPFLRNSFNEICAACLSKCGTKLENHPPLSLVLEDSSPLSVVFVAVEKPARSFARSTETKATATRSLLRSDSCEGLCGGQSGLCGWVGRGGRGISASAAGAREFLGFRLTGAPSESGFSLLGAEGTRPAVIGFCAARGRRHALKIQQGLTFVSPPSPFSLRSVDFAWI